MTSPVPPAAPGWYADPAGVVRWWDGTQWQTPASPATQVLDSPALAAVAQVAPLLSCTAVLPLVAWLILRTRQPLGRAQAAEALNVQLLLLVCSLPGLASYLYLWFSTAFVQPGLGSATPPNGDPTLFLTTFALMIATGALYLLAIVAGIYAAVQVGQNRYWPYPVTIRLIDRRFLLEYKRHWRARH